MIILYALAAIYITWVFYTAVMRLRMVRDAGKLTFKHTPVRVTFAYLTLFVGLILDTLVNLIICTVIGFELPKLELRIDLRTFLKESEWLTTARLNRWYASTETNLIWRWRRGLAKLFGEELLDDIDPDGKHIKG